MVPGCQESRKAAWKNLIDVRGDFKDADQVGKMLVFSGAMGACSPKLYPR